MSSSQNSPYGLQTRRNWPVLSPVVKSVGGERNWRSLHSRSCDYDEAHRSRNDDSHHGDLKAASAVEYFFVGHGFHAFRS